jgi:hypothetical protein
MIRPNKVSEIRSIGSSTRPKGISETADIKSTPVGSISREWVDEIEAMCRGADVAFFFKQWGGARKKATGRRYRDATFDELPEVAWRSPVRRSAFSGAQAIERPASNARRGNATMLRLLQEQSQMIKSANGIPMPMAPPIIDAKSESKFPSERNSRPDMPLLHEPPRVLPVAQG